MQNLLDLFLSQPPPKKKKEWWEYPADWVNMAALFCLCLLVDGICILFGAGQKLLGQYKKWAGIK